MIIDEFISIIYLTILFLRFYFLESVITIKRFFFSIFIFFSFFLQSFFFLFYIFVSASQKLNLLKETHFPFFYFPSFSKNQNDSLSMQGLLILYVCNNFNHFFPPKIFFLPSLSACALVRVEQQPTFSCQTIITKIKRIKPKKSWQCYKRMK